MDTLLNKLRAIISPVDAKTASLPCAIAVDMTMFSLQLACESEPVLLGHVSAPVANGLRRYGFSPTTPIDVSIKFDNVMVSAGGGTCQWKPVVAHKPVFKPGFIPFNRISFGNLAVRKVHSLPKQSFQNDQLQIYHIPPVKFKTPKSTQLFRPLKTSAKPFPKALQCLPIRKSPIPLHRFDIATKNRFRKALAEKAGITSSQVLINRVYDRVTMPVYQSIEQDDRGVLLCYPKLEAIGKFRRIKRIGSTSYLVIGEVLKTKERLSTLVPLVVEETDDGD